MKRATLITVFLIFIASALLFILLIKNNKTQNSAYIQETQKKECSPWDRVNPFDKSC